MSKLLFTKILQLPEFKGKWRLVRALRSTMAPYHCRTDFGFEMELDCFEWAQLHLAQYGIAEPLTMKLIQDLLEPSDIFVDVGAHVGFVSLVARQAVGDIGKVIAVEPQPYNCERLLRNWEINGFTNLDLHVAAAGPSPGFVTLAQQSSTDKSRLSLALPMHDATELNFTVPIRTLASIIDEAELQTIKLLKIDVEGFETDVLMGLENHHERVKNIVFESLREATSERERSEATCDWLINNGFEIRDIRGVPWDQSRPIIEGNLWATRK